MLPFNEYYNCLHEIAFNEDATVRELLVIVAAFAIFWGIFNAVAKPTLRALTYGKPWLRASCEREYERGGKEGREALGMSAGNKEDDINEMMKVCVVCCIDMDFTVHVELLPTPP